MLILFESSYLIILFETSPEKQHLHCMTHVYISWKATSCGTANNDYTEVVCPCYSAEKTLTELSHQRPTVGSTWLYNVVAQSNYIISSGESSCALLFSCASHSGVHNPDFPPVQLNLTSITHVRKLWQQQFHRMKDWRNLILCTSEFKELWNSILQY